MILFDTSRRALLASFGLTWLGCAAGAPSPAASTTRDPSGERVRQRFAELERQSGGRLGVAALETKSGREIHYRADERFPMCSTFKLPLAAAVLRRVDAGQESLTRRVMYPPSALLDHAPAAAAHVADGMTIEELCAASVTLSDNTTANLLLETLGGPAGLTAFFRSVHDSTSRLDRNEPLLNSASVGDERDTTTPRAMVLLTRELLLGSTLSATSQQRLIGWLIATQTGLGRLRRGLPRDYRAGDKTGTGENGATNDVCIAWPPNAPPLLIAAYSVGSSASLEQRGEVLAEVARVIVAS